MTLPGGGAKTSAATIDDTGQHRLRRAVGTAARRRHLERLAADSLPDLRGPVVMEAAWR